MTSAIYCIENVTNGMVYIGCTTAFTKRRGQHLRELRKGIHHNRYLQAAWSRYGENCFRFFVLEEVIDPSLLLDREMLWIEATQALDRSFGYNLCRYATSRLGLKNTIEQNQKISNGNRGKKHSVEFCQALSERQKGTKRGPCPPDVKEKIAAAQRGRKRRPLTDEHKAKISAKHKGRCLTPREFLTPEHKAAISKGLTGRKREAFSDEHRARLSESARAYYANRNTTANEVPK